MKKIINNFLDISRKHILIFDGGMGTCIQNYGLTDKDYGGFVDCPEYLSISRPDIISQIHADYLVAGAQVIETNTFGGSEHILSEHNLAHRAKEINMVAAQLAKKQAKKYSTKNCQRFVAGSIGPGSKLPTLGHISFDQLYDSYLPQVVGLYEGGVDCFLIETAQDLLQVKAAVSAISYILKQKNDWCPTIVQMTINENGTTLLGSDISAILAVLESLPIDVIGLNCSMGPLGMISAIRYLSQNSSKLVSILPNAGLPKIINNHTHYDLSPEDFAQQMEQIAKKIGVNIVGGCCGTTPKHIRLLSQKLKKIKPRKIANVCYSALSSLYQAQRINVETKPLIVGERANTNGSKEFKALLQQGDFENMASFAVKQEKEGSHVLDLSVSLVGRDEKVDMQKISALLNTHTQLPIMIDSTDPAVVEIALKNLAGRAVVNSINLEDGGKKAKIIINLCKNYGAAVVALVIGKNGMASTKNQKLAIAKKIVDLCKSCGLKEQDIFIDALTFTLGSGDKNSRNAGLETLLVINEIKRNWPNINTILGVSNISYGLLGSARQYLNSVFLQRAIEYGLDAAIFHPGKIVSFDQIPKRVLSLCDSLIFNKTIKMQDPLDEYLKYFSQDKLVEKKIFKKRYASPEKALQQSIVNGEIDDLEKNLKVLLEKFSAMSIISRLLLPAMDKVGRLFRQGKKQLPFVLRSAETMRSAMGILQPFLGRNGRKVQYKDKIVLATVRGDVHDIGKNLVDIILSANGYKVINLGVKQPVENIIAAIKKFHPQAIGLSGLLVESVRTMKEYLSVFSALGISLPVICGGAALTEDFVINEMKNIYKNVYYAKDALDAIKVMEEIKKYPLVNSLGIMIVSNKSNEKKIKSNKTINRWQNSKPNTLDKILPKELFPLIDREALFVRRWQLLSRSDFTVEKRLKKAEQQLAKLWSEITRQKLIKISGVYGIYNARVVKNRLELYEENNIKLCFSTKISRNLLKKITRSDLKIVLQLVTIGEKIKLNNMKLGKMKQIEKQFLMHGLAAEICEALAKLCNAKIEKKMNWKKSVRLSPGYPIWPSLSEQKKIFTLLGPNKIGVSLTEGYQMTPEYSTSAIVIKI